MMLSAIGGSDVDADGEADLGHSDTFWSGVFSFKAVAAAVTVFGLSGLLVRSLGGGPWLALGVAIDAGVAAMLVVAACIGAMLKLADDGTFRVEQTVGSHGVVYVGIPPAGDGLGKVHLSVQGRTVELEAAADGPLMTGTPVVVTSVVGPNVVEVARHEPTGEVHV